MYETHIGTGTESIGLGDFLVLTPICKQTSCTVEMTPECVEKYATLFENMACIRPTYAPINTLNTGGGHYAQAKLRTLGLDVNDYTPFVWVSKESKEKAEKCLAKYKKPIAVVMHCNPKWAYIREYSKTHWHHTLETLISAGRTPILFGLSNRDYSEFEKYPQMLDLSLKTLKALYHVIGEYVGVDTGDMHLMLAVGGKCTVYTPPNHPLYSHERWHYKHKDILYLHTKETE